MDSYVFHRFTEDAVIHQLEEGLFELVLSILSELGVEIDIWLQAYTLLEGYCTMYFYQLQAMF